MNLLQRMGANESGLSTGTALPRLARHSARVGSVAVALLAASSASADVRSEHPRIYLTAETVDSLKAELPGDPMFLRMQDWMDDNVAAPGVTASLAQAAAFNYMAGAAFVALMRPDEPAYADEARLWLLTLAQYQPNVSTGNDLNLTRARLYAMAIGYDWLHGVLSSAQRTTVRNAIVAFAESLDETVASTNYVSGPSRWANVVSLSGAIAVNGDDARLDDTLETVLANWRNGYNPALEIIGVGGGHHMGWAYGPGYSGVEAYLMWKTASTDGETWVPEFLHDAAYFHMYATNGSYQLPAMEDAFTNKLYPGNLAHVAVASGIFGNGHAEAFYRELEQDNDTDADPLQHPHELWMRLLTRDGAPTPIPLDTLPLSRFFSGAGFLVSRDSWERADATTLVFKASPFYTVGHHQRDEGSFTIDFKGPLLVDAGRYDGSGSDAHYWHFYARTVAHNSLLVRWPGEQTQPYMASQGLDGGQRLKNTQAQNAEQLSDPDFALKGIVGQSDAGACTWARSDTADTYVSEKLTGYTRDLLEVRRPGGAAHPAVFVLDRATLPAAYPASILWQFADGVTIDGSRISAKGTPLPDGTPSDARIRLETLRPSTPTFTSFSGDPPAANNRWQVGDESFPPVGDLLSSYWGRVEVSPATPELAPTWSTLIRVGEAELDSDPLVALDVGGDDWVGARLGNTIFAIGSAATTQLALPEGEALVDGCIAGLAPSASVEVTVGAQSPVTVVANADGVAVFDPDPSTGSGGGQPGSGGSGAGGGPLVGGGAANGGASVQDQDNADGDGGCSCELRERGPTAGWGTLGLLAAIGARARRSRRSFKR